MKAGKDEARERRSPHITAETWEERYEQYDYVRADRQHADDEATIWHTDSGDSGGHARVLRFLYARVHSELYRWALGAYLRPDRVSRVDLRCRRHSRRFSVGLYRGQDRKKEGLYRHRSQLFSLHRRPGARPGRQLVPIGTPSLLCRPWRRWPLQRRYAASPGVRALKQTWVNGWPGRYSYPVGRYRSRQLPRRLSSTHHRLARSRAHRRASRFALPLHPHLGPRISSMVDKQWPPRGGEGIDRMGAQDSHRGSQASRRSPNRPY